MLSDRSLALIAIVLAWPFLSAVASVGLGQAMLGHAAIAFWLPALHFGLVASIVQMAGFAVIRGPMRTSIATCFIVSGVSAVASYVELCMFFEEHPYPLVDYLAVVVAACAVTIPILVFLCTVHPLARAVFKEHDGHAI